MTRKLDYDPIAPAYDRRYAHNEYPGTEQTLRAFVAPEQAVLEVGCGTGHWLAQLASWGCRVSGLDPSEAMLARAAARVREARMGWPRSGRGPRGYHARLVRGRAEELPFGDALFDRVVCVNALHHIADKRGFLAQARRVLRPGGRFLTIGLDPSMGPEPWCIYEYFETTLALDQARYPAAASVRTWLHDAGFVDCTTEVAERILLDRPAREALEGGLLDKSSTSQLALLDDAQYERGIACIRAAIAAAEAEGRALRLTGDLRLYGTQAAVPA